MTIAPQDAGRWWSPKGDSDAGKLTESDSEGHNAFIALIVFTCILMLAPQIWFPVLMHFRIAFIAGGAALAFLLWDRWHYRKPLGINKEITACLMIAAWAFLTLPLSYWPGGSVHFLSDLYIKTVLIFFLLATVVNTARRLRIITTTLVLCSLPLGVAPLINHMTGNYMPGVDDSPQRVVGYQNALSENPNDLALMLNLIIPLGIAILISKPKPVIAFLCILTIALDVLGIIMTYSRAGFLGLATITVVYFVKLVRRPKDRKWAVAVLMLAVLSLPILPGGYMQRIATITDVDADPTGSAQVRWQSNVAATRFIMQHPIVGAGMGMSILALNDAGGLQWHQVHNVYLEHAVDLGLPGLMLFLLLFYGVFRAARSSRRQTASVPKLRDLFLLDEALEVSLIVFAVAGFFHPVAYHFYFYYIAGLALAARSATDAEIRTNKVVDFAPRNNVAVSARERRWFAVDSPVVLPTS